MTLYMEVAIVLISGKPTNKVPCASSNDPRKVYMEETAMPGTAAGKVTCINVRIGPAPTSRAASSCWRCTFLKELEGIHIMKIIVFRICTMITPVKVPISWNL